MDSFIDSSGQSLYNLDIIQDMVIQLPNREEKEFISMGRFATKTGSPIPSFLKANSPPNKKSITSIEVS